MAYFPMFINLKNERVLVVGGGKVALRKIKKLLPFGAQITVVAPEILDEIEAMEQLALYKRCFCVEDLEVRPAVVIAATNQKEVNRQISTLCRERNIPVNVVDDPDECSFLFPALVQQGNFSAGISTAGASPTAAIYYKEKLQGLLPENLDGILDWLEEKRQEMKKQIPEQAKRAGLFRQLFDACLEKGAPLTENEVNGYMDMRKKGSVALVGAGCGKADLITVRGLRLLQQCEAVVYDDLIDPELLDAVPETALRIYMGKRSGAHSALQSEINQKLIDLAESGLKVVRLKGGDPYLFGRGGEEMLALKEAGIACQEVPGIPSAIGIAAEAGIPVTHRGASRGLHIITAHTSDMEDGLPADFDHLANLSGTLVFLMGLKQLPKIAARLMAAGKSGDTPAAVLSGGNSPNPARVRATLSTIVQAVDDAKVVSPAIIVIGDVAALDLNTSSSLVLGGVTVGITGTEQIAKKQQKALGELGAETEWVARSIVKELPFALDMETLSENPHWLVFTSGNGVKIFFNHMRACGVEAVQFQKLQAMKKIKFAVIGLATGEVLKRYGIFADLCPEVFTSEGLGKALVDAADIEEEILLLRSAIGSPVLVEILEQDGYRVRDIATYQLESVHVDEAELPKLDYLTFSSASGVGLYFEQFQKIPEKVKPVCIGEVTAKALEKYTDKYLLAKEIIVDGIVQAIVEDIGRK